MRASCISALLVMTFAFFVSASEADPVLGKKVANSNDAGVLRVIDRWAKAFRAHNLDGIMSVYAPGDAVIAYDISPPLQYVGNAAYRKNYADFLAQYNGPMEFEARDVHVVAGKDVAVYYALERMSGTLKSGEKSTLWVRATTGLRMIHGQWLIVHDHISVPMTLRRGKQL